MKSLSEKEQIFVNALASEVPLSAKGGKRGLSKEMAAEIRKKILGIDSDDEDQQAV